MAEISIILTDAELAALEKSLGARSIEQYLKDIAAAHIKDDLDKAWAKKTEEEKKNLLK